MEVYCYEKNGCCFSCFPCLRDRGLRGRQGGGQPGSSGAVKFSLISTNSGNDGAAQVTQYRVDKFNEINAGKYEAVVEWIPGAAEDIRAKLKILNSARNLPASVTQLGAEPAFAELLIRNNRLVDLKPYFDADPEWKRLAIPESVEFNTRDGKMLTAPSTTTQYIGIYYNKQHFADAGIAKFPETWEEFWTACDKLKEKGHMPLSLHLTETGWLTMLMGTSYLGKDDQGSAFINRQFPTDFNVPPVIDMLNAIKKVYTYTTLDAKGGNYALAANNFSSGITSMIPNGPWIMQSLNDPTYTSAELTKNIGYATFPLGLMISDQGRAFGEAVSVDVPENVQRAAVEYVRFLSTSKELIRHEAVVNGAFSPLVRLSEDDMKEFSVPMRAYAQAVPTLKKTIPNYQSRWDPLTQHEVIETEMINMINGVITPEEFASKMTVASKRYVSENQ
jgi:raffinose/stachyose/melibiose transport system substrate-binding protein